MESGLDGRNNAACRASNPRSTTRLNGVRPRWPEQFEDAQRQMVPHCQVSMESGLDGRNNPEVPGVLWAGGNWVSMESGLDGRNNGLPFLWKKAKRTVSQWSPA